MAKIAYEDKNKEATVDTAPTLWRDIDANEVKNSVNALYDEVDLAANSVQFDTTPAALPNADGILQWNETANTLDIGLEGGTVRGQVFEDTLIRVKNNTGTTLLNGKAVYIVDRQGNLPLVAYAKGDVVATSKVIGILTQDLADGATGRVNITGYVRNIKTDYSGAGAWGTTWNENDLLYVSKSVAGQLTNVEPAAPHHSDIVGSVGISGGLGIGSVLVSIDRHKTMSELSDINGTALTADGQIAVWHNDTKLFDFDKNINSYIRNDVYERHIQLAALADGNVANQATPIDFFTVGGVQFATSGTKNAFCQWEIADDWNGANIFFEVDWFPDSAAMTGTDTVEWQIEYRSIAEGELINAGTSKTLTVTDSADYLQYQTKHSRVTLPFNDANQPLTKQDHLYFRITRNTSVANDFGGSVTVPAFELIYFSTGLPTT